MNAALFYPEMVQAYSSKSKHSSFGPNKASIVSQFKTSPKRGNPESVTGKSKLFKKNNFYEEHMASAEKRLKQRGILFDEMLRSASRPIDEMIQTNYPQHMGTYNTKKRVLIKRKPNPAMAQNHIQMSRSTKSFTRDVKNEFTTADLEIDPFQ